MLGIGQVAKRTGITVEAVRFYEKQDLITAPQCSPADYRQYPSETVNRVRFNQRAKDVRFTPKDIVDVLARRQKPGRSCTNI